MGEVGVCKEKKNSGLQKKMLNLGKERKNDRIEAEDKPELP